MNKDIELILSINLPWERLKGKTVAVSGTRGHIASWLCRILGYLDISVLPLNKPDYDVCKPINIFNDIDYIFHVASYASPTYFKNDPVGTILPNTLGTYNLLELAKQNNSEFIYFSTSGVYGWHPEEDYPLTEEDFGKLDCVKVENCYLESKRLGEQLCMSYNYQHDITVKLLRLGICYGPGMKLDDGRVMGTFIKKVLDKEDLTVYNESVFRSFMYITDVLSAIFHILFYGGSGPYNVAAEEEFTIFELASKFCELYPDSKLQHVTRDDRLSVDFNRTWMNVDKLSGLGWNQKISLEDGIKKTVESYR